MGSESASFWLSELANHPIFAPSDGTGRDGGVHLGADEYAPPSPDASVISFASRSRMDSLASIAVDDGAVGGVASATAGTLRNGRLSNSGTSTKKAIACIARRTELLVAAGKEVRMMSLPAFKTRTEGDIGGKASTSRSSYKTLSTPAINFKIQQLVVSPNSRFVAVVGVSQAAVFELPRKGWEGLLSCRVECSHDPIGSFYHSPSSPAIARVRWHPWGESDSTLLILTNDGLLREYNILEDPEEPTQVVDFCHSGTILPTSMNRSSISYGLTTPSKRATSRSSKPSSLSTALILKEQEGSLSATPTKSKKNKSTMTFKDFDEDATTAVSFCFGDDQGDWSPFTLFCLMQNGDLYSVCPYLPKTARIPSAHLTDLAAYVSAKIAYLTTQEAAEELTVSEKRTLDSRYAQQLKFVQALLQQQHPSTHLTDEGDQLDMPDEVTDPESSHITVHYPSHFRAIPIRQGPFLFQPAPRELEDSAESLACDIVYTTLQSSIDGGDPGSSNTGGSRRMSSVLVAYTDGKLDVCIDCEKVEAQWGRLGETKPELPTLLVYETVELFTNGTRPTDPAPIQLVTDPEYSDTIYAYHSLGAHSVSLQPLFDSFFPPSALPDDADAVLDQALKSPAQSNVTWLLQSSALYEDEDVAMRNGIPGSVVFLGVFNDVYLGYGILILTADHQLVPIELSLRTNDKVLSILPKAGSSAGVGTNLLASSTSSSLVAAGKGQDPQSTLPKAYTAFAESSTFTLPPLLSRPASQVPATRFSTPASARSVRVTEGGSDGKPSIQLTIEMLKFIGQTVEKLDGSIKDLIRAGNTVQERLELHQRELPRQLEKLQDIDSKVAEKDDLFGSQYSARVESVKEAQRELERRADRILQKLIDNSQPELSGHERRWMEELDRVKEAVQGGSSTGLSAGKSLQSRVERLREQLEMLKPQWEGLVADAEGQIAPEQSNVSRMGQSQKARAEQGLAEEARLVADARHKIEKMSEKLARVGKQVR